MAKTTIQNYVFKPGIGSSQNLYPNAYQLLESNKTFIQKETAAWIQDNVDSGNVPFAGYSYNSDKCERDIGYNIDAYLKDLRYGGNENTYNVVKYYWDEDVAQIDGDRLPEIETYTFIRNLIVNNIIANNPYSAINVEVSQTINAELDAEAGTDTILTNLVNHTRDVINNGLSSFGTFVESGVGRIKLQGRFKTSELLLITNTTKNEIIYNFSSPETGASIEIETRNGDTDFPSYLQTTDGVSTITLNYDTSSHSATDDLQIFVEETENGKSLIQTRPYNFGTDAIERQRVAASLSMLDADFEYGLQPTKWSAIGVMRGYPSVYEIPGTDTQVSTVVTDASAGTDGIGASLITVTTVSPHGFAAGTPITIKALENAVSGAARAEGSFVITTVPTDRTFTYFAKSKVGDTNGEVLSTGYTQLRQAGFYTGASIGNPSITVSSNGYAGTLTAELQVGGGQTIIPFDGPSPEIGAPLTNNAAFETGTQVTGVIDSSAGGGTFITPTVEGDYPIGSSTITVTDATGIVQDLAVDGGSNQATYVDTIVGNDITFTDPIQREIIGNTTTYSNISGSNIVSDGSEVSVNVSRTGGVYTVTFNDRGIDYEVGDRLIIPGFLVGGQSPENDLEILVDSIISDGSIDAFTVEGTAFDGTATVEGLTPSVEGGDGFGLVVNIEFENNTFTSVTVSPGGNEGTGYIVNDRVNVNATLLAAGASPLTNDAIITIDGVDSAGGVTALSVTGTAPDAVAEYIDPPFTTSGSGVNASFTVNRNGSTYSITVDNGGSGFAPTDTITILGTDLGGASPTHDLTITVDNVGGATEIIATSITGVAFNGDIASGVTPNNLVGSGAEFTVELSGGGYTAAASIPGNNYAPNQVFIIDGGDLFGETGTNDLTITIQTVDGNGGVTSVTSSGTAAGGTGNHPFIEPANKVPGGTNASFDITRSNSAYTASINLAGTNYQVGNRILITGDNLGGVSPLNDVTLRITGETGGAISAVSEEFIEAYAGDDLDLLCVLTISEPTNQTLVYKSTFDYEALATLGIEFPTKHGIVPGQSFLVTINSDDGSNNHTLASGSFIATDIPDKTRLTYQARAAGTINTNNDDLDGNVYIRPDSFFIHRPFDGGVQLGTGGPQHSAQAIRQSKKYIRYQSGKGIMYTTGALFAPSYDLRSVSADDIEVGSTITVVTDDNDHGVQEGGIVRLLNIETPGYNSGPSTAVPPEFDYTVTRVVDERTFEVESQRRLGSTTATLGFNAQMSVVRWHGSTVRSGIFDDQNGIFWEYDGTQISVVQRTGTFQIAGTCAVDSDSNEVIGTNTRFKDQLKEGDRIIIRGMTHVVTDIESQTALSIAPDFRGVGYATGAKMMLITDKKVKQSDFNLDRLDGTGPSGYDLDPAKMQMIGIQYSWYGAGFIDFMLRGQDGNFIFAHRMRNSNVNTEAFMRSGNLPVRYEVTNEGPPGKLAQTINSTATELVLEDSSFFPDYGVLYIDNEIISFSGNNKDTNTLGNLQRAHTFQNFQAGATRSYTAGTAATHNAGRGVILISNTTTPLISHWGSAFITDGGFDDDRGYIFSYAETGLTVTTTKQTAFMIRLAPSVSNAIVGDLGERELLNRAQLLLQGLEITSDGESGGLPITGGIVVEGILNPQNYPSDPSFVQWSGLSGLAQGGQPSFAQVASGGAITWTTGATATTTTITALPVSSGSAVSTDRTRAGRDYMYLRYDGPDGTGSGPDGGNIKAGDTISGPGLPSGTKVEQLFGPYNFGSIQEYFVRLTDDFTSTTNAGATFTYSRGGDLTNRNFGLFTKASVDASGISNGVSVDDATTNPDFPANSIVSSVSLDKIGTTEYYDVRFNNSFIGTLTAGSGTVQFIFQQPPFAQPGETVFSFIAVPGERSMIDLSALKELTNTPLGGRGTFPNGPDVLALNVYKATGGDTSTNIIIRWGEAQA